jgi:hypothetical protein
MRAFQLLVTASILIAYGAPAPASAQKQNIPAGSQLVIDVTSCRSTTDPTERLACYDASVSKLVQAQDTQQLVILDKTQVKETRKGLFGFTIPSLNIFGDGDGEFSQIESTLKSLESDGYGKPRFVLADGAIWAQIDDSILRPGIKPGASIVIRKAAIGSFFMKINNHAAIRVKRVG